ncbi:myosin light chain kinase family member 4-like isoform X1 [Biomphalaria glabrata]|uniref:Myosin light chain kinase family member 4-like isoform X1 n=2 Tax=Biomphalaria glabrata TaxID=6526 RepID=A0A9W3BLH3_BIOGL|nr:myosin light chain kinase family member 4-like isoform X1 [Biomphalaria glabrata]
MYRQGQLVNVLESILLSQNSPWSPYFRGLSGSKLTPIDALTLGLAFMYGGADNSNLSGVSQIEERLERCEIREERDTVIRCDLPEPSVDKDKYIEMPDQCDSQCDSSEECNALQQCDNYGKCDSNDQLKTRVSNDQSRTRVSDDKSDRSDLCITRCDNANSSLQCYTNLQCDNFEQRDTRVQSDGTGQCDGREVNNNDSNDKEGATGSSIHSFADIVYYKAKFLMKTENTMNLSKTKVKVDESEPNYYEEAPFERRDVMVKKDKWVTDLYTVDSILGKGKFGEVKRCRERRTGRQLAAKFIEVNGPQDRLDVLNEVEIMKHLQHPRLLQLYDAFENRENFCLVMELVNGGELFERVINDDFILTEKACVMFMRQICDGVAFMHSQSILHLDMKPENILCLTREGNRIKIIDFGLARKYDPKEDLRVLFGTPEFVAPEVVNFDRIYPSTDMWSVGVICYVLLSGLSPFMGESESETLSNVTMAKWDFTAEEFESISSEAKDFISKLLVKEPRKRMSASDCLEHQWLRRSVKREGKLLERSLSKKRLRKFVYRRKWQKAINAMLALRRMGVALS